MRPILMLLAFLLFCRYSYAGDGIFLDCSSSGDREFVAITILQGEKDVFEKTSRMKRDLSRINSEENRLALKDIVNTGFPLLACGDSFKVGSSEIKRAKISFENKDMPVVVSYTLEKVGEMLNRKVAILSVLLSGADDSSEPANRWMGLGRELWDLATGTPQLRIIEIIRKTASTDKADFKFSYAEALLF